MGRPSAVTVGLVAVATTAASLTPSAPPMYPTANEIRQIVAKDDSRPSGLADNGSRGTGPDGLPGPDLPPAGYLGSPDRPYSTPDVNPLYPTNGPIPGATASDGGGGSSLGIPGIVLTAYQNAASKLALSDPTCQVTWQMIAGIGKVESNHAWGAVAPNGDTSRRILGPVLDGSPWSAIRDTDNGVMDGNSSWDRAVGPMQFIPSSWQIYSADGNDDGFSNPHNVFDASLATGKYLCNGNRTLLIRADLIAAIYSYNHSDSYVRRVLSWIDGYTSGGARPIDGYGPAPGPMPVDPGPDPDPEPESPDPDPSDPAPNPTPTSTNNPKPTPNDPKDPVPPIPGPTTPPPNPSPTGSPKPTTSPKPPSPSPGPSSPAPSPGPSSPAPSPGPSSPAPSPSPEPSSPAPSPSPEPSSPPPSPSPEPSSPAPSPSPSPSPACSPTPTPAPTGQGDETGTPSPAPSSQLAPSPVATATGAAAPPAALLPGEDGPDPTPDDDCSTVP